MSPYPINPPKTNLRQYLFNDKLIYIRQKKMNIGSYTHVKITQAISICKSNSDHLHLEKLTYEHIPPEKLTSCISI